MGTGVSVGLGVLVGWAGTAVPACVLPTDVSMAVRESTTASGVSVGMGVSSDYPPQAAGGRYRFAGVKDLDAMMKNRLHAFHEGGRGAGCSLVGDGARIRGYADAATAAVHTQGERLGDLSG
jgi:hypothetical protein